MKLLDRYIARQVFVSAMFAMAVLIVILVLGNVFKEILRELAARPELSLWFLLKFVLLVIPVSLSLALPFSFLTAILLTFGRLSADSEFVSMRMAGQSMARICVPVAIIAVFFTVVCAYINLSVTPWAKTQREGFKNELINLVKKDPMLLFTDKQVMDKLDGNIIYASKEEDRLTQFQMVRMKGHLPEAIVIAQETLVDAKIGEKEADLIFDMSEMNILVNGEDGQFDSVSRPAFVSHGVIPVSIDRLLRKGVNDKPSNISLRRIIQKSLDPDLKPSLRAKYRTELSIRLAFSFACIPFALIGVPLGITAQRRESTAGFVMSIGIAVGYYVLLTLMETVRDQPEYYPHLLVWIPNLLIFILGFMMFRRLSKQ